MVHVERGSSVVECRTRNQVSPGSNPSLLPFRRLGIFVLSIAIPAIIITSILTRATHGLLS